MLLTIGWTASTAKRIQFLRTNGFWFCMEFSLFANAEHFDRPFHSQFYNSTRINQPYFIIETFISGTNGNSLIHSNYQKRINSFQNTERRQWSPSLICLCLKNSVMIRNDIKLHRFAQLIRLFWLTKVVVVSFSVSFKTDDNAV